MSLDTQVALRPPRPESAHFSRAARQIVPPFLQKLYEIVNDPANESLIKWSDNGDSFYVLNHERFAREVLGRWFKHQKFASFVRQLNMYGFHKIPHLQQGVLKSDADTEPWHFEHPNFHRGQPDLLCLIQRKKQPAHGQNDDAPVALADADATTPNPNLLTSANASQLTDMNTIVSGVDAIKRHQQAISSDLSALKQSNDALWKEAIAARQRHAKHQDTINRILKFLAGVFGHAENPSHTSEGSHTPPQVTPRIRQRLMIKNGSAPKRVDIMEVDDDEVDDSPNQGSRTPFSPMADRFTSIPTPATAASTPSAMEAIAPLEAFSLAADGISEGTRTPPPNPTAQNLSRTNSGTSVPRLTNGSVSNASTPLPLSAPPSRPQTPNLINNGVDPSLWQAALHHVISRPSNLQRIVQAFATQQQQNLAAVERANIPSHTAMTAYDPNPMDYTRWLNLSAPSTSTPTTSPPVLAPSADEPSLQVLLDESNRLQKIYRDSSEIDADMEMLQTSINSLIQNLGMDPTAFSLDETPSPAAPSINGISHPSSFHSPLPPDSFSNPGASMLNGIHGLDLNGSSEPVPDYLLDSLLSQIDSGAASSAAAVTINGLNSYPNIRDAGYDAPAVTHIDGTAIEDASTEQLTAFLDDAAIAAAAPDGAARRSERSVSPQVSRANGPGSTHIKRKSDARDAPLPTPPAEETGRKVKRKR